MRGRKVLHKLRLRWYLAAELRIKSALTHLLRFRGFSQLGTYNSQLSNDEMFHEKRTTNTEVNKAILK